MTTCKNRKLFIAIDGLDRTGKSSLVDTLENQYQQNHVKVFRVREPGGSEAGEAIRNVLINTKLTSTSQVLLFTASRLELLLEKYREFRAYDGEAVFLCDRYEASTYVYQDFDHDYKLRDMYRQLSKSLEFPAPDYYVLLDVDYDTYNERKFKCGDGNTVDRLDEIIAKRESFNESRRAFTNLFTSFRFKFGSRYDDCKVFRVDTSNTSEVQKAELVWNFLNDNSSK